MANGEADSGEACALRPLHAAACLRATGRGLHQAQTVHQTACVRARRQYLIRFRDLLAPNAKRCAQTVPAASGDDRRASEPAAAESANAHSRQARISRARLLKRVFQIDLERCPNCGDQLKTIAASLESAVIVRILTRMALQATAGARACKRERGPLGLGFALGASTR